MDTYPQYIMPTFQYGSKEVFQDPLQNITTSHVMDPVIAFEFSSTIALSSIYVNVELGGSYNDRDQLFLYLSDSDQTTRLVGRSTFEWEASDVELCGNVTDLNNQAIISFRYVFFLHDFNKPVHRVKLVISTYLILLQM